MSEFVTLVIVAVLAFLAPGIARRLRMPVVVGEIMLGMLVGLAVFTVHQLTGGQWLTTGGAIDFLAEIGFILLLFLAGLEIDFNMIEERGLVPLVIAFLVFGLTLLISYLIMTQLGFGLIGALIMATTSIGIVVPTMREFALTRTEFGQNTIITAIVIDFGTMLLLTAYAFHLESAIPGAFSSTAFTIAIVPLIFLVVYLVYRLGGFLMWHRPEFLARFFKSDDPTEGGVRATLALMFIFVGLALLAGIEAILGAFLAGMMISLLFREGALLEAKLYGFGYGFFVPLFFIHLGLTFDFPAILEPGVLILLPMLIGVAFLVKTIPALLWLRRYGIRRIVAYGAVSASGLTLMLAAASIGLRLGLISSSFFAAVVVLAIVTATVGPIAFRALMRADPHAQKQPEKSAADEVLPNA